MIAHTRGIYGRKYTPKSIPISLLTHINYAFANVNAETGEVVLSDPWADVEVRGCPSASWRAFTDSEDSL